MSGGPSGPKGEDRSDIGLPRQGRMRNDVHFVEGVSRFCNTGSILKPASASTALFGRCHHNTILHEGGRRITMKSVEPENIHLEVGSVPIIVAAITM